MAAPAIGFDLDMTLVDSRPVSRRALERLVAEHGARLDLDALMASYGLPLATWLPAGVDGELFRALQAQDLALAAPMPGAGEAVAAARRAGADVVVVTSATAAIAEGMLAAAGLCADRLRADVWGSGKVAPLREEGCWAFVGDHADDMAAARAAGAIAVGVDTGTTPPHGAQVRLGDLNAFAPWLASRAVTRAIRRSS
jgi:phosphoglycolate phosphatase